MVTMRDPRVLLYFALLAVAFASGAISQFVYPGNEFSPVHLVAAFVGVVLSFAWYRFDTDLRGYRRSVLLNIGVIAFPVLALPYYFFRTRGFLRGLAAVAVMLVSVVLYTVLQVAGTFALYHVLQS